MKAYNKEEVDMVFSSWENDLKELSVIDVIPIDVLNKIRVELSEEFSKTDRCNWEYKEGLNKAFCIIDKYISRKDKKE